MSQGTATTSHDKIDGKVGHTAGASLVCLGPPIPYRHRLFIFQSKLDILQETVGGGACICWGSLATATSHCKIDGQAGCTAGNSGGRCLYVSGVPGTGKTATVLEVVRSLRRKAEAGQLPAFQFVELNSLRLPSPQHAYSHLYEVTIMIYSN